MIMTMITITTIAKVLSNKSSRGRRIARPSVFKIVPL